VRAARLRTLGDLARQAGVDRTTMWRRMRALAATMPPDAAPFLVRVGGRWYVEIGRLRQAYPQLIEPHLATRAETDSLRREVDDLRARVRAQGARIRALEGVARQTV
jgi:hypothetical protein